MPTWAWLVIIALILLALWLVWQKLDELNNNAGKVASFTTDIEGLVGIVTSTDSNNGQFTSRLGNFFATLAN